MYLYSLGLAYASMGQYEEGIAWCEKAVRQEPDSLFARLMMTVVYSLSGRDEQARAELAEVLRIQPKFTLKGFEAVEAYEEEPDFDLGEPIHSETECLGKPRNQIGAMINNYWVQAFVTALIVANAIVLGAM